MKAVIALFAVSALVSSVVAFADPVSDQEQGITNRRPIAQCYNPAASNNPGAGSIMKLKLDMIQQHGLNIVAGIGIDMIPATNSSGYPAIYTTGGVYSHTAGAGDNFSFVFGRPGSFKYLDVDSRPIVANSITVDRRMGTVTIDIAPGLAGKPLVAKGCRFF